MLEGVSGRRLGRRRGDAPHRFPIELLGRPEAHQLDRARPAAGLGSREPSISRVLWTLCGVGIGVLVMLLAGLLEKLAKGQPQPA